MKVKFTIEEYKKIEHLVDCALEASNKKEAQKYIDQLQSYENNLYGNASNIMGELISYVKSASGRVKDKEHWIDCVRNRLYVLGSYGVEKNS